MLYTWKTTVLPEAQHDTGRALHSAAITVFPSPKLPRHRCITAGADTIADLERHRGLHLLPAKRLLAPGTDDRESDHDSPRVLRSFLRGLRPLSHWYIPLPLASRNRRRVTVT